MSKKLWLTLVLLGSLGGWPASAQPRNASELLQCAQANWNALSFVGVITIKVFRPDFSNAFRLKVWTTADNAQAMIRVLAPASEAGSAYVRNNNGLWFYAPGVGQPVALPGSSLGGAFFGSDVAVEDLYRGTLDVRYDAKLLGTRTDSTTGRSVARLQLVPKQGADVVYGKLELDLDANSCAVQQIDFYDQRQTVIREATFSDFVTAKGLVFATRSVVKDLTEQGKFTEEVVESFELGTPLPEQRFTLACLADEAQCG